MDGCVRFSRISYDCIFMLLRVDRVFVPMSLSSPVCVCVCVCSHCTCAYTGTAGEQKVMFSNHPEPYTDGSDSEFNDINKHTHTKGRRFPCKA